MKLNLRVLLLTFCVLTSSSASLAEDAPPPPPPPSDDRVATDLNKPDLLIVSQSLSQLFRDTLKVPLLQDLLTEDFAFYYEHKHEGAISLSGAMKRIAFEHEMTGLDHFLSYLLDSPVEAAFWKGFDGKLSQFVIAMDRTLLKNALEKVAKAAAEDTQLKALPEKLLAGGEKAQAYQVQLGGKSAFFAVSANKFFLYSKESMPLPSLAKQRWSETLTSLLGVKKEVGFFGKLLGKGGSGDETASAKHSLLFSARFLSFGYSALFPSVRTIGMNFSDKGGWKSSVLLDGEKLKGVEPITPWAYAPKSPSLCVSLPLSVAAAEAYLKKLDAKTFEIGKKALAEMSTTVGACWYADSRIYTPLFVVGMKSGSKVKPEDWSYAFQRVVGAAEIGKKRLEKTAVKKDGEAFFLTRDVGSRFGTLPAAKSGNKTLLASKKFFPVTLFVGEKAVALSPDAAITQAAGNTILKRAPSLKETVSGSEKAAVLASPGALAKLFRAAVLDSLPASQESLFRASVASYLLPSLDKMKKHPDYLASLDWDGDGEHWETLEWQSWR